MSSPSRRRGLRSEVQFLLPVAMLVLLVLTAFTLVSYRTVVALMIQERQAEAAGLARQVVDALPGDPAEGQGLQQLRGRLAPQSTGVSILDEARRPLVEAGSLADLDELLPVVERPVGLGPSRALGDTVIGLAPFVDAAGNRRTLRLDLAARVLGSHARALPILTAVVVAVSIALFVTVLLYLRQLMEPYERLLDRARKVAGSEAEAGDEVDFLLQTFDRALDALSARPPNTAGENEDEDFAAIERTLAPSLESGLLLLDREGSVLALNALGAELLGVQSPVAGLGHRQALADQPQLAELLSEAIASERGARRRQCTVRVAQRSLTLGLSVHPLRRDDGRMRGWLVLFADLTRAEQRAQERRLAESLAQIGEITAGVAHEMRNSLASLRGHLSLLERRETSSEEQESLAEIRHEADHLKRVLDDFLSFARPGSARMERLDLFRLAQRAVVDPALGEVRVRVQAPTAPLPAILGDPQLLERAVRNVVHNAVQAQGEDALDAQVEVCFGRAENDDVLLIVEDRGCGIPEELRDRLFAPFVSGRADGVGLGLALTHRILELHHGQIRLEDRDGGGVRAVLSFPADSFATDRNNRDEEPPSPPAE